MLKDIKNYNLLKNNTFGISETCRRFIEFSSVEELADVLNHLTHADEPILIIGGGSNLLLTKHFDGTVLRSDIKGMQVMPDDDDEHVLLRCGSGECFDDVVAYAVSHDMYGLENLSIIPGDVGASAVQNIGAYGSEAKDVICTIEALEIATGQHIEITNADCHYGYRQSRFKNEWKGRFIITYVTYRLSKSFVPHTEYGNISAELNKRGILNPTAKDIRDVIIDIRNAKLPDPAIQGNAGSFFMNPIVERSVFESILQQYPNMPHYYIDDEHEKIPAGWMIEQCGWKGRALGNAAVHDKQALVLVNIGGATGADVIALSDAVCKSVKDKFGVDIHPEVNFV